MSDIVKWLRETDYPEITDSGLKETADEIERLRASIDAWRGRCDGQLGDIHELQERIEELERQAVSHVCQDTFTEAQVDAAVEYANKHGGRRITMRDSMWLAFNKLGIERCEECSGTGIAPVINQVDPHTGDNIMEEMPPDMPCPDCNGHGWVRTVK